MKLPEKADPIHRFPRTEDSITLFIAELRAKYPPPEHIPYTGMNPADLILESYGNASKKDLKRWCVNHALQPNKSRRKMIWRLWRHWRAAKFEEDGEDPYIGYGKGFKSTRTPNCACGFQKRADVIAFRENKEIQRAMVREERRKLSIIRFPRLLFPRLNYKDSDLLDQLGYRKWRKKLLRKFHD